MPELTDMRPNEKIPWPIAIFFILFSIPFMLIPFFFLSLAFLDWGTADGYTMVFLSVFFGAPAFVIGLSIFSNGLSALSGRPSAILNVSNLGPRPTGKGEDITFGGNRTGWSVVFIGALLVPFIAVSFGAVLSGLAELLSGNLGGVCLIFIMMPFALITTSVLAGFLSKRYLKINHEWDTITYTERLFRWQTAFEQRKLSEAMCVREWTVRTERRGSDGETIILHSQRIRIMRHRKSQDEEWDLDISGLLQSNGIPPEDVAKAIGIPYKPRPPADTEVELLELDPEW